MDGPRLCSCLILVVLVTTFTQTHASSGWGIQDVQIIGGDEDIGKITYEVLLPNYQQYGRAVTFNDSAMSYKHRERRAAAAAAAAAGGWTSKVGGYMETANSAMGVVTGVVGAVTGIMNAVNGMKQLALQREQMRIQEEQFRQQMEMQVITLCDSICVTEWGPWTMCGARCGGGYANRNRTRFDGGVCEGRPCRHQTSQRALCNTGCPNGGFPWLNGGGCDCPSGFDGQCCENQVRCPYTGDPDNGAMIGQFPAIYGAVVKYSCNEGFARVGDSYQVCTESGDWTGQKPTCDRIRCNDPGEMAHGRLINGGGPKMYGEIAAYMCEEGYDLVGPETRTCTSVGEAVGRWTGFTPMCLPKSCGPPNYPLYGEVRGTEFTLGHAVDYVCSPGFRLVGSASRTCLSHGGWSGNEPQCQAIMCEAPYPPENGRIIRPRETHPFGTTVRMACDEGYLIDGSDTLRCIVDPQGSLIGPGGVWDSAEPTCQAAICGDPGDLENGVKDGSLFFFPNTMNFKCFPGYVLRGLSAVECQEGGIWSGPKPTCEACALNFYKEDGAPDTDCVACPAHTETRAEASTSVQQCLCVEGYSKDDEGLCQRITCPVLEAPTNGTLTDCQNYFDDNCEFDCDEGHIMERGSSSRTCNEFGQWTGSQPFCQGCPLHTYKSDLRSCLPCPRNSHTEQEASSLDHCLCDRGYGGEPGTQCDDLDECEPNEGRGPCSDVCENSVGSYRCLCSIPGYVIDDNDRHSCRVDRSCRNLTEVDAPANGGLVCHWYWEENSQQCSVRCNMGFEFPSRTNNFELCGPTTGYRWSHEERGEVIEPCVEEFFPGFQMEANTSYFVRACNELTPQEQDDVKRNFASMLSVEGICMKRDTQVCNMEDVGIICGRTQRRRKRGVWETVQEIDFKFKVNAIQLQEKVVNCSYICTFLRIPMDRCPSLCMVTYKRFLKGAVLYSQRQLNEIYSRREAVRFAAASRVFEPISNSLQTSDVESLCATGMRSDGEVCVPCAPGTFYEPTSNTCQNCRRGTFQPSHKAEECLPCPPGEVSYREGATACTVCPPGRFGDFCVGQCESCIQGRCNPVTGHCDCDSGWEGEACDIDIDGCRSGSSCLDDRCLDTPAPGTGYTCMS